MAYNNNSYSGYNRGYSGGGQSRPPQRSGYGAQQRTAYNQPLAEIQAEKEMCIRDRNMDGRSRLPNAGFSPPARFSLAAIPAGQQAD